ncbi:MAG TPA: hypothetical protein VFB02_06850 [Bradyrhizobium sp.]|nr:hypothetical protein [Bradyrhizobium sp.]
MWERPDCIARCGGGDGGDWWQELRTRDEQRRRDYERATALGEQQALEREQEENRQVRERAAAMMQRAI